jgi:hypothetical protein
MKRRIPCIARWNQTHLLLIVLLGFFFQGCASVKVSDFTYTINSPDTNTVTLTGYTGSDDTVVIPATIDDKSVTHIGLKAFYKNSSLSSATVPDSVTTIGLSAFFGCTHLTNITIPASVTSIGNYAFSGCTHLTNITIPASVTSIGSLAFWSCNSLSAILADANNGFYCSIDGVLFSKDQTTLVQYPPGKAGGYTIPTSVTSIGNHAFRCCYDLTSVTIGDSVTAIGNSAFEGCIGLMSVTISDSVASIGDSAFRGCTSLTNITIPASVTSIEKSAFRNCNGLTAVNFQGDAPTLGSKVFYGCGNATVYYLFGTTGWTNPWGGLPTVLLDD